MALFLFLTLTLITPAAAQSNLCRTSCGPIPVPYPFGIDPGCGNPRYHNLLSCHPSTLLLLLHTPSGRYPVHRISSSSSSPHLLLSDPSSFSCSSPSLPFPYPPFALDTSTPLSLSPSNHFLFFNCSPSSILIRPNPPFCDKFPDRCPSVCDSAAYLCRNLPHCPDKLIDTHTSCCAYRPTARESVRMMLRHCSGGYASVYWRPTAGEGEDGEGRYGDEVAEFGARVDFEVPVIERCRMCREKGGGVCGYDVHSWEFLCLCEGGNVTTYCGGELILFLKGNFW